MKYTIPMILFITGICACVPPKNGTQPNPEPHTAAWPSQPPWNDQDDFVNAQRGLMGQLEPLRIPLGYHLNREVSPDAPIIWDLTAYADQMISGYSVGTIYPMTDFPPPDSLKVNPNLWRNAVLNSIHGVFEVDRDNIYQVRGYDLSNMTMVRASELNNVIDWIVIDPLMSAETAYAAWLNFTREFDEDYPNKTHNIKAVIFTHSHADHYGGIDGLESFLDDEYELWTPVGFAEHAISENVIVGNAMSRRATYMYGAIIDKGPDGQVDGGLGKTTSTGAVGLEIPDEAHTVDTTWDPLNANTVKTVAGLDVYFQNVPGTEAPSEMMFYFPDYEAFCGSEDVTHTFHNVLTLRGAQVRDPLIWAKYLDETIDLFIDGTVNTKVLFSSHHWPTWNEDLNPTEHPGITMTPSDNRIKDIIEDQRDLYKYVHDQTVRLTNHGFTIQEIGDLIELPTSLGSKWHNRNYYGTLNHNSKAVYQRYIGWFDGNPANLHQLPPQEAGAKYAEYLDWDAIQDKIQTDLNDGNYRWVAMLMNHYVYGKNESDLHYQEAKDILIQCYRGMAVEAESGPWRNFYLVGASELEGGVNTGVPAPETLTPPVVEKMEVDMTLDYLSIRLNAPKVDGADYTFRLDFTDTDSGANNLYADAMLYVKNGVLRYKLRANPAFNPSGDNEAIIRVSRENFNAWLSGQTEDLEGVVVEGSNNAVTAFFAAIDEFEYWFNIVTPNSSDNGGFIPASR